MSGAGRTRRRPGSLPRPCRGRAWSDPKAEAARARSPVRGRTLSRSCPAPKSKNFVSRPGTLRCAPCSFPPRRWEETFLLPPSLSGAAPGRTLPHHVRRLQFDAQNPTLTVRRRASLRSGHREDIRILYCCILFPCIGPWTWATVLPIHALDRLTLAQKERWGGGIHNVLEEVLQ